MRSLSTTTREQPYSQQLKKKPAQQQRPSIAPTKKKKKKYIYIYMYIYIYITYIKFFKIGKKELSTHRWWEKRQRRVKDLLEYVEREGILNSPLAIVLEPFNLCFCRLEFYFSPSIPCHTFAQWIVWRLLQKHPKGNQSWILTGRTDAEAETSILWPPDVKNWLIWKDTDAGKDWRQEEKGTTEDEMVGWHHQLNAHEFK